MQRRKLLITVLPLTLQQACACTVLNAGDKTMPRILIIYYSRHGENYWQGGTKHLPIGNTARLAKKIQSLTGGDLYEIETVKTYPANYRETTRIVQDELEHEFRPELKKALPDFSAYDKIFIGHPIWWGRLPPAMNTFLELAADAIGTKAVYEFCTHEGSGFARAPSEMQDHLPKAKLLERYSVYGSNVDNADDEVRRWLQNTGVLS